MQTVIVIYNKTSSSELISISENDTLWYSMHRYNALERQKNCTENTKILILLKILSFIQMTSSHELLISYLIHKIEIKVLPGEN
jgi:hypothetical protein